MNILGIHHVAFAHSHSEDVHEVLTRVLDLPLVHTEHASDLVERMIDTGGGYLQLLEPAGDDGVIQRFIDRRGAALHHVALEVEDITATVRDLLSRGVEMIDSVPRPGAEGTLIAFLHPRATAGLLIEVVEVIQ